MKWSYHRGKLTLGDTEGGRLSCNFIIVLDHVYEDDVKLQTVIIPKKGRYSDAKWSAA